MCLDGTASSYCSDRFLELNAEFYAPLGNKYFTEWVLVQGPNFEELCSRYLLGDADCGVKVKAWEFLPSIQKAV